MLSFFKTIGSLFRGKKKPNPQNHQPSPEYEKEAVPTTDKVMFQPNTLHARNPIEHPHRKYLPSSQTQTPPTNSEDQKLLPPPLPEKFHSITIECNEQSIQHLQNLCRFFELSQPEAIARGLWLLTLARDIELANKKIGIIGVDKNGLVTEVLPINIV